MGWINETILSMGGMQACGLILEATHTEGQFSTKLKLLDVDTAGGAMTLIDMIIILMFMMMKLLDVDTLIDTMHCKRLLVFGHFSPVTVRNVKRFCERTPTRFCGEILVAKTETVFVFLPVCIVLFHLKHADLLSGCSQTVAVAWLNQSSSAHFQKF